VPELPEVEAVRRALEPALLGARFTVVDARRPDLRTAFPPDFTKRLVGRRVERVDRRAKYLIVVLDSGDSLLMHLGMSGSFRISGVDDGAAHADAPPAGTLKHDHVVFVMSNGAVVTFNDPRRFGFMDLVAPGETPTHVSLAGLGPEPLASEFDAAALARALRGKKSALKVALLDQRVVAGLGNIYAVEALNRARLSPKRRASTLATRHGEPRQSAVALAAAIKRVLNDAVVSSMAWQRDEPTAGDDTAYFPHRFRVYDRAGARCRNAGCPGRIRRIVQAGRATFYCPSCQR
jgi:formamidopyrimidine-DNA glycosylase